MTPTTRCRLLIALLCALVLSPACTRTPPEGVVGVILPLTGPLKQWGLDMQAAVEVALAELPADRRPLLVPCDNGGTARGTTTAFEHVQSQGATVVIGPLTTDNAITAGIVARGMALPAVLPAATGDEVLDGNTFSVRMCHGDAEAGRALAAWARDELGLQRVAVVIDLRASYSLGLTESFSREFQRRNGLVVDEVNYYGGDPALASVLDEVAALDVDGALLAGYAPDLILMVEGARDERVSDLVLLGGDAWGGAGLPEALAGRVKGAYHTRHFNPEDESPRVAAFLDAYRAHTGSAPSDAAALAYDAASAVFSVFDPKLDGPELLVRLRELREFPGVTGTIDIDARGAPGHKAIILEQYHDPDRPAFVARIDG
ncbi:MAG: ABC transporter substrate-binding protein [Planctomycetota bacterium]|jgi:branched-chain amino acid transport system substrate-binding protein